MEQAIKVTFSQVAVRLPKPSVFDPENRSDDGSPITSTDAIEFQEFSCVDSDGKLSFRHVCFKHQCAFHKYLRENYDVLGVDFLDPFIVVFCRDSPFPVIGRPFSIAGYIVLWKTERDFGYDFQFHPWIGESGSAESLNDQTGLLHVEPDSNVVSQAKAGVSLSNQVLLHLADQVFPDCEAISAIGNMLVVELPKVDEKKFQKRLKTLPCGINNIGLVLEFHNGPLANSPSNPQAIVSSPDNVESVIGDSATAEGLAPWKPQVDHDYIMDSPVTGRWRMRCVGRRVGFERIAVPKSVDILDSQRVLRSFWKRPDRLSAYIKFEQQVFASNDPDVSEVPTEVGSSLSEKEVPAGGEVGAMVRFCNKEMTDDHCTCMAHVLIFADWGSDVVEE